jgi:HAD superfamily hydrolase (TIGR01509 family)
LPEKRLVIAQEGLDGTRLELKAVVLDMDGTITNFNIDYLEARRVALDLLAEMNLRTPDMNEQFSIYLILKRLKATLDADTYTSLRKRLYRLLEGVETKAAQEVTIYPGVLKTLDYLQKRALKLGLVTNNGRAGTNLTLSRLGLSSFFSAVVTRDDCEEMKPDAGPVREVLRGLSVEVGNAILVGDGVMDIEAARATGVSSVGVATGPFSSERLIKAGPDYLLGSVNDILQLVELLDGNLSGQ